MDFFDFNKYSKPIVLKGGQTKGCVKISDDYFDEEIPPRESGKDYVEEYLEQETKEAEEFAAISSENIEGVSADVSALEITSSGTFPNVHDIGTEDLTHVYDEYYKNKPKVNNNLGINKYRTKILSMIELNEIIIIAGPTGCGKTTQVPQFILDSFAEKHVHCNIIVTQPRRIAAINVSKRVCEERSWTLGGICGYKIGLKEDLSKDTRLTYVTVGVFLQMLINKKHMNDFTHIILDEIHEREESMDFLLFVIKKLLNTNSRNVKVILMSATADVGKFATYFRKRISGNWQPAPVITVGLTTNYVVQVHYLEELSPLGELPEINFDKPCISEVALMTCVKLIKQFERLDDSKNQKKSVLVFLPGICEIEDLYNKLKDPQIYNPGPVEYKWTLIPLHSSIMLEEQALAFRPPPTGSRKIILATNIAESSITVPDVMFVIDFCLTKVLVTDPNSNFTSLQLCWASKANCIQRAGRAGRVMEGRVYRMVYKDFYQKLDAQCTPCILRCPLEKIVLQSKLLDMGPPKAILALTLDPPDLSNIERTILVLKEVGALLLTHKGVPSIYDGDLTALGRLMALFPVDIHITRLIMLGYVFSCLDECIVIGAAMSLKSVFSSSFQARLKSYNSKLDWADGSCSDCIAFLNVYEVWKMNQSNGYFKRSAGSGEAGWARRHFIQLRALQEVDVLVNELTKRLKMCNIEKPAGLGRVQWTDIEKAFVLKFVIAGAFYPNYFGRGERGGQVCEKDAVKMLGGRDPFTTVYLQNYPFEQPPELYTHLIKEQLSECKEDMKVSYDNSSKVYVEFRKVDYKTDKADMPFNGAVPGKISMAVYRAVKMRQTRKSVDIKVLPPEQAKKMAENLGLEKKMLSQTYNDETTKEKLFQSLIPGVDVSFMDLKITHVVDPSHFWALSKDRINDQYERQLFRMLNTPNAELEAYVNPPDVGEICVAPYSDDEEVWMYRARVESYLDKNGKKFAQVFFIDYGNTELVPVTSLMKFGPKLLDSIGRIPVKCFQCCLTKVKPSVVRSPSGKWTEEAVKEFKNLIEDSEIIGSIYSVVGGVVSLVLYKLTDLGTSKRQININQHLIKAGHAEETEESYLSKANNDIRTDRQLDSDQMDVYSSLQKQEDWRGSSFQPPNLRDCKLTLKLRGPYSPLEMKIFSYTRGGLSKHVSISQTSVNSVLLDSDPQDPHERLIVAGNICQNQTGNSIILHQTTAMPNIHGLAALIPFVFAPTIEMRVNDRYDKYTGFLCGLGVDDTKRPMFPEHDMEIVFDCEFTFEDFSEVNKLRFFMSLLLLSEGNEFEPINSLPDVVTFQNNVKTSLLKLIEKHRPHQELEFSKKDFKWGLVEPNVFATNEMALSYSKMSVFPLHPGVSITPRKKGNLKKHVEKLHSLADKGNELEKEMTCELCFFPLPDLETLKIHLKTEKHKMLEEKFKNSGN